MAYSRELLGKIMRKKILVIYKVNDLYVVPLTPIKEVT